MTTPSKIEASTLVEGETLATHTPGPWFVGAQNDTLYVTAGRPPAVNNDFPWHEAPRVAVARIFTSSEDDCFPVDQTANARLIAASPDLLATMRQCADILRNNLGRQDEKLADVEPLLRAAIAKAVQP